MVISRYFLPYTYIAKSQLSSVNCQPKPATPRTNHVQILPTDKLPASR